jgi:mercuric ion transport protein
MKPSKTIVTTGGSLVSAALSFLPLSCCLFPRAFSFLSAGGLAFAIELMPYRPYFIALTVAFLGAGFYFAYQSQETKCSPNTECSTPQSRRLQRVSLWAIAALTIVFISFPYLIPYLPMHHAGPS